MLELEIGQDTQQGTYFTIKETTDFRQHAIPLLEILYRGSFHEIRILATENPPNGLVVRPRVHRGFRFRHVSR